MKIGDAREVSRSVRRPKLTSAVENLLLAFGVGAAKERVSTLLGVPERLLVVKVHGMGDSVLIRMIVQQLSELHPEMRIGVLGGSATREVMSLGSNWRFHAYSQKELSIRSAFSLMREIRQARYDAILNFEQGSIAGTAFLRATGIPIHLGFFPVARSPKTRFLTHGVRFEETRSMWSSFVALARIIDPLLGETTASLKLESPPETLQWLEEWWRTKIGRTGERAVALHLGCGPGMDFKRWPIDRFIQLADRIALEMGRVTFILTGTATEQPLIREFKRVYRGRVVDASDAGTIGHTAAILKRTLFLVSNDTGVMHLGAALGVPTVGLFGPTSPAHWSPVGQYATAVYDTAVECSPCVNNYQNYMPSRCVNAEHGRCMRDIGVGSVMNAVRTVVSEMA